MQSGGVALGASNERSPGVGPATGLNGTSRHREAEALGLQRYRQPGGSRPVVGENVRAGGPGGCGSRRQQRIRDRFPTSTGVFRPVGIEIERQRERPGRDVVEAVILFVRLLAAPAVAVELGVLTLHKGALQLGFRLEHRLRNAALRLIEIDDVAAGWERLRHRRAAGADVGMRRARGERLAQPRDLDAVAEQQTDNVRRRLRIVAGDDDDALQPIGGRFGQSGTAEVVVVLQTALPVLRRRLERRERRDEMVGDAVAEGRDAAVVPALAEFGPAVGLVGHPRGALEGGPLVPVAHIEEIEDAAHEILPAIAVERRRVAAPVRLEPLRRLRRQVHVHGLRDGGKKEVRRRRVVVHEHLRAPPQHAVHHRPHFRLALGEQIAVHVEAIVVIAPRDAPGLVLLERPRVVRADGDGVVPRRKALMPVGVRGWV